MDMADTSIRSNQSNLSRGARPESGRLHRKYPYRWLFDQVHVKSLVFHVEICLLAASIIGLYCASQMRSDQHFDPIPLPGFDGLPYFGETYFNSDGNLDRPNYETAKNLLNLCSYFLIFSVVTAFMGMKLSETSITRRNFPANLNPAVLLVPSAISVISLVFPLSIWAVRCLNSALRYLVTEKFRFSNVLDAFRLTLLPIILIWVIYAYLLYGFWLGVLYYQRRGDQSTPTSNNPFRRPLRKHAQQGTLRFQGKAGVNLLSDLTAVTNELSSASPCLASTPSRHDRSLSPRSFRHLETVDEEAQSRSSSD